MAFVSCTSSQFIFIFLLKRLFWLAQIFYCNILYICCSLQNKHPYSFFASWSLQFGENIHIKLLVECVRVYQSSYKGGAVADCVDSYPISVTYQTMEWNLGHIRYMTLGLLSNFPISHLKMRTIQINTWGLCKSIHFEEFRVYCLAHSKWSVKVNFCYCMIVVLVKHFQWL